MSEELFKQSTIPLTSKPDMRPTFRQFRERYRLSYLEIAQQAKVRVCRVYWMELGYRTEFELALRILAALSKHAGKKVRFEEIQGIRLKQSFLV